MFKIYIHKQVLKLGSIHTDRHTHTHKKKKEKKEQLRAKITSD